MCIAIASLLKFVITTLNVLLGLGFLIVALFGLLLKTSGGFINSILDKALSFGAQIDDQQAENLSKFVLDNATSVSVLLIVVGLGLAAVCFIGAFASCCGCGLLLKIYAIFLTVLLIAQIIAVAVLYSDPEKLTQSTVEAMRKLLQFYGNDDRVGQCSTTIWNFAMTYSGTCCGMNGVRDFYIINPLTWPPGSCCISSTQRCTFGQANTDNVAGCCERIKTFTYGNLKIIMYVALAAIVVQSLCDCLRGLHSKHQDTTGSMCSFIRLAAVLVAVALAILL